MSVYESQKRKVYFILTMSLFGLFFSKSVWATSSVTINATVPAICGNTVREGAEGCDDGNLVNGDGCSNVCAVEEAQNQNNNNNNGGAAPAPAPVVPVVPVVPPPVPEPIPVVPIVPNPDPAPEPEPVPNRDPVQPVAQPNDNPVAGGDNAGGNDANADGAAGVNNGEAQGGANGAPDIGVMNGGNNGANNAGAVLPPIFAEASSFVSSGEHIKRSALQFFIGNGSFLAETANGMVTTVSGDTVLLSLQEYNLASRPIKSITVTLFGETKTLVWSDQNQRYEVNLKIVQTGKFDGIIGILYTDGAADSQTFGVLALAPGVIRDSQTKAGIAEAVVTLVDVRSGVSWNALKFHQINPVQTGRSGVYSFVVPRGQYVLRVEKDGYRKKEISSFEVSDYFVRKEIFLIKEAPTFKDAFQANASLGTNIKNVALVVGEKTKEYAQVAEQAVKTSIEVINKVADDPKVEQVTKQVVAPTVTTVAVATVVPSLWSLLLPLLRFVFLQPVLLLGKKKRKEWGMVYNSLNKLPIDLAVVRLIDKKTKRVKQSRVTDLQGRFLFMSEPGEYTIEVTKPGFVFPSHVLAGVRSDGKMVDIYHGETIGVSKVGSVVTPNVPIDPGGEQKTPQRILKEKRMLFVQHGVSLLGVVLTALSVYVSPTWYMWVFLGLQLGMYFLFRLFVKPKKPKGWGIVYDAVNKKPIGSVVIRLFTKEYNKLVSTQTSDSAGRYAFLVGPSEYYITVEKSGYESFQSESIKIESEQAKASVLKQDVSIKKK